jgi:hypothetical protein
VKARYQLWVIPADRAAIRRVLLTCPTLVAPKATAADDCADRPITDDLTETHDNDDPTQAHDNDGSAKTIEAVRLRHRPPGRVLLRSRLLRLHEQDDAHAVQDHRDRLAVPMASSVNSLVLRVSPTHTTAVKDQAGPRPGARCEMTASGVPESSRG